MSSAGKVVGGILALTGILGIAILGMDQILALVPMHYYALVVFVIIDFLIAGCVVAKPLKSTLMLAGAWSIIRILLQIADVSQATAPGIQMNYLDFATYLFNPVGSTPPNPMGVPGALIDLILLLELIVAWVALSSRSSSKSTNK
jgi:hypothetical protein